MPCERPQECTLDAGAALRTIYNWLARYQLQSAPGVVYRASRPHRLARALTARRATQVLVARLARQFSLTSARTLELEAVSDLERD